MRKWWAIGAAVLLLSAAALGVWYKRPHHSPQPPLPDLTLADDEVAQAIKEARRKVVRRPSALTWGRLGELFLAHEYNEEATECFTEAEHLDPHAPAWPYLQASILVADDPEQGIACLERAVRHSTAKEPTARLLLAETLLERDRLDEAEGLFQEVYQADPENARANVGLARAAMLRQQWQRAQELLKRCQNDPHARKRAHSLLAKVWLQLHDANRAHGEQEKSAQAPPDQKWPDPYYEEVLHLRRGLPMRLMTFAELIRMGRVGDAVRLMQQTLQEHPKFAEGWMALGGLLVQTERLEQAETCFQRAVEAAPTRAEAWARLGTVQLHRHSPKAADSLRTAMRLKPDHAQAHYNLGQFFLREQHNRAAAAHEFRAALHCRPDFEAPRQALAELAKPMEKNR